MTSKDLNVTEKIEYSEMCKTIRKKIREDLSLREQHHESEDIVRNRKRSEKS